MWFTVSTTGDDRFPPHTGTPSSSSSFSSICWIRFTSMVCSHFPSIIIPMLKCSGFWISHSVSELCVKMVVDKRRNGESCIECRLVYKLSSSELNPNFVLLSFISSVLLYFYSSVSFVSFYWSNPRIFFPIYQRVYQLRLR